MATSVRYRDSKIPSISVNFPKVTDKYSEEYYVRSEVNMKHVVAYKYKGSSRIWTKQFLSDVSAALFIRNFKIVNLYNYTMIRYLTVTTVPGSLN